MPALKVPQSWGHRLTLPRNAVMSLDHQYENVFNTCPSCFCCSVLLDFKTQVDPDSVTVDEPLRKPRNALGVSSPLCHMGPRDRTQVSGLSNRCFRLLSHLAGPNISFKMFSFSKCEGGRAGGKSGADRIEPKLLRGEKCKSA